MQAANTLKGKHSHVVTHARDRQYHEQNIVAALAAEWADMQHLPMQSRNVARLPLTCDIQHQDVRSPAQYRTVR